MQVGGFKFNWRNKDRIAATDTNRAQQGADGIDTPFFIKDNSAAMTGAGYVQPTGEAHDAVHVDPTVVPVRPFGLHFTRHAQPDPGMAAVSYDVLQLPVYTPVGSGIQNKRQWRTFPSNPVVGQAQGVQITTIGNPGFLAGTLVSSPLIDTRSDGSMSVGDGFMPIPGEFVIPSRTF